MSILSEGLPYMKPVLVGTALGAGAGALTAPAGKKRDWAVSGAVIGGISSGPAQVGLKRIIRRGSNLKNLAKSEIPHQTTSDIFKWTGIGAGAGAAVTAATGGYKDPKHSSRVGQFADTGIDLGEIIIRSLR